MRTRLLLLTGAGLAALPVCGCDLRSQASAPPPSAPAAKVAFRDVTSEVGIRFAHVGGASGKKYFPETMGAGVIFIDYDGDGRQDLLYLNGAPLPGYRATGPLLPALYRNAGEGKFEDATRAAGLAMQMYAMGGAVGDYDNDGDDDLYVTAMFGPSRLFRNDKAVFHDVGAQSGVSRPGTFPTSAAWVDYDKDGRLDLFVCNYVRYASIKDDLPCYFRNEVRSYCIPAAYGAEPDCLYRNEGGGKFKNVTRQAGVEGADGKSLGVAIWDLNDDGWPDISVANDTTPTYAYINQKDGTFKNVAAAIGVAYGVKAAAKAGMGIDIGDDRNNGLPTMVMSNFSGEMLGFYRDDGTGVYQEQSVESGVGRPSEQLLGFGVFFFDYDSDGWQDLFVANGHVQDNVALFNEGVTYEQPPLLLRNTGGGRYQDMSPRAGPPLQSRLVARGAAWGDIDDDGRLDVAILNNQGPALLWRNESEGIGHWLKLRLAGTRSNRNGYGARVIVESAAGKQLREARSGSSYCSASDQRLHFGLGSEERARRIEIRWPSGAVDVLKDVPGGRVLTVTEGGHP